MIGDIGEESGDEICHQDKTVHILPQPAPKTQVLGTIRIISMWRTRIRDKNFQNAKMVHFLSQSVGKKFFSTPQFFWEGGVFALGEDRRIGGSSVYIRMYHVETVRMTPNGATFVPD